VHGYEAGDALFRSLVGALRRATRPEDLVARSGDGRFALLLRDCDEHEAQACVQRLLLELERRDPDGRRDGANSRRCGSARAGSSCSTTPNARSPMRRLPVEDEP